MDVFPASLAGVRNVDRVVQVRMRGCLVDRDFAVLIHAGDHWCRLRADFDKGTSGNGCAIDRPILRFVHLTGAFPKTVRKVTLSHDA